MPKTQQEKRERRKLSIRKKVNGTAERPRLTVFRSSKHIYAQVVNDDAHQTLATASTLDEQIMPQLGGLKKSEKAKKIGAAIAERSRRRGSTRSSSIATGTSTTGASWRSPMPRAKRA